MTRRVKSHGARLLSGAGATEKDIASVCSVTPAAAHFWVSGQTKPRAAARERLLEVYGVPPSSWDEDPPAKGAPTKKPGRAGKGAAASEPESLGSQLDRSRRYVSETLTEIKTDTTLTIFERTRLLASLAQTLKTLSQTSGEIANWRSFALSPQWARIQEAIETALGPFPTAAEHVEAALRVALEGMGSR